MIIFSFVMMCLALISQGLYFWARDGVTQHLPLAFLVSDVVWTIALLSLGLFRRYPWVTLACAWILFLTSAIVLEPFALVHSLSWFFKRNCFTLVNLVFAHSGFYFKRRQAYPSESKATA